MAKRKDTKEILAQIDNELKEKEAKANKEMAKSVKEICEEDKAKKTESEPASTEPKTDEPEPEKKPASKQKTPTKEEAPKDEPKQEAPVEVLSAKSAQSVPGMANLGTTVFGGSRIVDGPGKAFKYHSREYDEDRLTPNYWWATQFGSGDIQVLFVYYKDGQIDHLLTEKEAEQYLLN